MLEDILVLASNRGPVESNAAAETRKSWALCRDSLYVESLYLELYGETILSRLMGLQPGVCI